MTESDAIQSLAAIGDTAGTYATLYFTATFAYVTVAYLVGAVLTRFQLVAATLVYLLSASIFGITGLIYTDAWLIIQERESTVFDEVWMIRAFSWRAGIGVMLLIISVLSVYFMFDIRRRDASPDSTVGSD